MQMFIKAGIVGTRRQCQCYENKAGLICFRKLGREDVGGTLTPGKLKLEIKCVLEAATVGGGPQNESDDLSRKRFSTTPNTRS